MTIGEGIFYAVLLYVVVQVIVTIGGLAVGFNILSSNDKKRKK